MRYAALLLSTFLLIVVATTESRAVPNAGVKVTTVVNNANSPSPKAPSDFQFTIAEVGQPTLFSFAGSVQPITVPLTLSAQATFVLNRVFAPSGYATTFSGDCNPDGTVVLLPTQVKSCTLTHTYVTASESGPTRSVIKVIKQINANITFGQVAQPSDFTMRVSNQSGQLVAAVPGSAAGVNIGVAAPSTSSQFPNRYIVSEVASGQFTNYIPTYSGDCDRTGNVFVLQGQTATCVVTNTRPNETESSTRTAVLKIIKVVEFNEPQFGSIPQPHEFSIEVFRGGSFVATVPGSSQGMNVGLAPANASSPTSYTVRELVTNVSNNFFPIYGGDCTATGVVTLLAGELKTCVVTNAFVSAGESSSPTALLKIKKRMDGNRPFGQPTQPEEFTIDVLPGRLDPEETHSPSATVQGSELGLSVGLNPGTSQFYTVRERPFSQQFFPTYTGDCRTNGVIPMTAGQISTCIVTNSFLTEAENGSTAVLKIIKQVDPTGDFHPPQSEQFEINVYKAAHFGTLTSIYSVFGSQEGRNVGLAASTTGTNYTVRENPNTQINGYLTTYSGDCNGDGTIFLIAGEKKTCVLTNSHVDEVPSSSPTAIVNIRKRVEANDFVGTPPQAGDFFITLSGDAFARVHGSESGRNVALSAGSYFIEERTNDQLANFVPTYSGDCTGHSSLLVPLGSKKTCAVTNTYIGGSNLNRAPVAFGQNVSLNEDTPKPITLVANDPDGNPISYIIQSLPAHGTLSGTGANRTYTPSANFNGNESFTFQAREGDLLSNVATVSLKVFAVNDAPTTEGKSVQTIAETPLNISLTASDVDGDQLSVQVTSGPSRGTLSINGLSVTYTPNNNFAGQDSFKYVVSDGAINSSTATITITVVNGIVINDVAVGENNSGSVPLVFTVGLLAPATSPVTVQYSTANANATAGQDYTAKSGSVTIPTGQSAASITITAFGDALFEPNEIFLINLSNPTNAVLKDGTGTGTILNDDPPVGISSLTPENSSIDIHQQFNLALTWTHPERWRLLETIDLHLVDDEGVAMWVQFHEPSNTFREINPKNGKPGDPSPPGSSNTFQSNTAVMHLQQTTVVGTGPTGPSVTINYNFSFKPKARGRTFRVEVFATDDFGHQQGFDHVGTVTVPPH